MPAASWSHLAPELLLAILEPDSSVDPRQNIKLQRAHKESLLACALVSRHWADCAQVVLFRSVQLPTHVHLPDFDYRVAFGRLIATLAFLSQHGQKRYLPASVRKLTVEVGDHWHSEHDMCPHVSPHIAALAVSLCPNLRHLNIRVREGNRHSFSLTDLALLRRAPAVTHLTICADNSLILPQLLHIWPALAFLDTGSSIFQLPRGWTASLPPSCNLQEYQGCGRFADIENIAAPFAPSLRKLTVISPQRCPGQIVHLPLVARLPALEHAVFDCEFNWDTLSALPPSVRHLALVFWDPALFQVVFRFIAERADSIRVLSLLAWRCFAERPQPDELQMLTFCARRGIQVRYMSREELVTSGSKW